MKAVFLDRDGTLIVDPPDGRVDSFDKIALFPDTLEALKLLSRLDYGAIIITNQNGIAEGRITTADFEVINGKVIELLEKSGVKILKTYMCPHDPSDNCECRKPKPTMILEAAQDFSIDLAQSWMIGEHATDVEAGIRAGTKTIFVQSGNAPESAPNATCTAPHLLDAIKYIVEQS